MADSWLDSKSGLDLSVLDSDYLEIGFGTDFLH